MAYKKCYHCGDDCERDTVYFDDKSFCCNGCKTVYEIFSENELTCYYDLQANPGSTPPEIKGKYDFLSQESIVESLLEFKDEYTHIVSLYIPHIHCSSCIWILENLNQLQKGILQSQVNFNKKTIRVYYNPGKYTLKELVLLLASIGYEPYISLNDTKSKTKKTSRNLIYKLAIAGFAFGNIMFLSFPEYFEVNEFWLEKYKVLFRWLMFTFSLPVVFYAAQDYFVSAYKGLTSKLLNIDVPIALGISVLFLRSSVDIIFDLGSGFFDSLAGLVFFLLLGKFFQQKTYAFLSFERDYKSYFPVAVTKIKGTTESSIPVYNIKKGDCLLIRNEELIPVDAIITKGIATIDYSFVTGESKLVEKNIGDKVFAGGKQIGSIIELKALNTVEKSYLTQLWNNDVFNKPKEPLFNNITNSISKHFTLVVLTIALIATTVWLFLDATKVLNVFTSVLIIACPCAIALAAPFAFGNMLRIFGRLKFYLKNSFIIEELATVNTLIFDKTGTLTSSIQNTVKYEGSQLTPQEEALLKSSFRNSNHPLSRSLYNLLKEHQIVPLNSFEEYAGKGIKSNYKNIELKAGSANFVGKQLSKNSLETAVHISSNNQYKGKFTFYGQYRKGISKLFNKLKKMYDLVILSGDTSGEEENLKKLLPTKTKFLFNQSPQDKLEYIKYHQTQGAKVFMIGDGLNDAGALMQSNVGVAISENTNVFTPACDAILSASKLSKLHLFFKAAKQTVKIVKWAFVLSFIYNVIGLYFAVTGQLSPLVAAILMPLSSISIVVFTTIATNIAARKLE